MLQHEENKEKWLAEDTVDIQHNAFYMHRTLDSNDLKDALKYSVQMLSELQTSLLSAHKYYELCELDIYLILFVVNVACVEDGS
ncbi:hypothetical protein BHE74_00021913 [Ensete ventricosum]|uniref:Uncharacterized protein n=1 Tax=Ensete ventricosum TaxID=4639 RepID=A0A426XDC4_ENSVE|nr:hypothetical protein B296_00038220 [Ensete ventricosum]RWW70407.1 hypothetical protein BHE74_00021913 [Ensete ventricosum]RZS00534.1 hypothetical protein BHM03_00030241 [Ensete ventricosum]